MPSKKIGNDGKRDGGHATYKPGKKLKRKQWREAAERHTNDACRPRDTHAHRGN
ncbi:MAG: hypothetical protein RLZZ342_683 [Candidatus Parcubacteria bacterium]|jgi:hypothetical protein